MKNKINLIAGILTLLVFSNTTHALDLKGALDTINEISKKQKKDASTTSEIKTAPISTSDTNNNPTADQNQTQEIKNLSLNDQIDSDYDGLFKDCGNIETDYEKLKSNTHIYKSRKFCDESAKSTGLQGNDFIRYRSSCDSKIDGKHKTALAGLDRCKKSIAADKKQAEEARMAEQKRQDAEAAKIREAEIAEQARKDAMLKEEQKQKARNKYQDSLK